MDEKILESARQESMEGNTLSDSDFKHIIDEYKSTLDIPDRRLSPQILICPVGLVGAGKSTVLNPICKKLPLVRIATDEIRKLLQEKGFNFLRTREIAKFLFHEFLTDGHSVVADADCIDREVQEYVQVLKDEFSLLVVWIHINSPEEFIIQKLTHFKHTWLFRNAAHAIEVYHKRKPLHEAYLKDVRFYFTFDPSKNDIDKQVASFLENLHRDFAIE